MENPLLAVEARAIETIIADYVLDREERIVDEIVKSYRTRDISYEILLGFAASLNEIRRLASHFERETQKAEIEVENG